MSTPPFSITAAVLKLTSEIERMIGRFEGLKAPRPQPHLRKQNRARTVQGSVAIEGNTIDLEQVTAMLDGKRVIGPRREILEVQNAIAAYELAPSLRPWSEKDLLRAHGVLTAGLLPDAGRWRTGNVGVLQGTRVAHVAPQPRQVPRLMGDLLGWVKKATTPLLIRSCVVHYELQFIHPFSDGNGRVGRLWQHVVLLGVSPVFEFLPVESLVRQRQSDYYEVLGRSDRAGNCDAFLEFSLATLRDALVELLPNLRPEQETAESRLEHASSIFVTRAFSRQDYLRIHPAISTATASRDLKLGVDAERLERTGDRRLTTYRFRQRART